MKDKELTNLWKDFFKELEQNDILECKKNIKKIYKYCEFNNRYPSCSTEEKEQAKELARFLQDTRKLYRQEEGLMVFKNEEFRKLWKNLEEYLEQFKGQQNLKDINIWHKNMDEMLKFYKDTGGWPNPKKDGKIGVWKEKQQSNFKKISGVMKDKNIYKRWKTEFEDVKAIQTKQTKKNMSKPEIKPKKKDIEIKEERQQRAQSKLSQLHKTYKTMTSQNLNTFFKENPEKWKEYHKISQENEDSFPEEEIQRNRMIKYLENLPGKKKKVIADLGCGFAEINQHFIDNSRFEFHNFDHYSSGELVVSRDIKNTELDDYSTDIAILSLAMWGSNCKDYLKEAHRILDTNGILLIAEPYKRWNKELDEEGNAINKLVKLLKKNNFTIVNIKEEKFMFIECRKN